MLEAELGERAPPDRPALRVVDQLPPAGLCTTERLWFCDQIHFLARVYALEWFVRQEIRGYTGVESLPDDELKALFKSVGYAISCIKDNISFEDAGLIRCESDIYED